MVKRVEVLEVRPLPEDVSSSFEFARVRDDDGAESWVKVGECYRNGTSPGLIKVGDVGTREAEPVTFGGVKHYGFSCPKLFQHE